MTSKGLHVAAAISDARFLAGTHCIEFVWDRESYEAGDAYGESPNQAQRATVREI